VNRKPLEDSGNADLIGAYSALRRAARGVWERAVQTGGYIVQVRNGEIVRFRPIDHPEWAPEPETGEE
jgi:hypothetical protein